MSKVSRLIELHQAISACEKALSAIVTANNAFAHAGLDCKHLGRDAVASVQAAIDAVSDAHRAEVQKLQETLSEDEYDALWERYQQTLKRAEQLT